MAILERQAIVSAIPRVMFVVIAIAAFAHGLVQNPGLVPHDSDVRHFFDLGYEQNLPTWIANIFWFLLSASAFVCFHGSAGKHWIKRVPWLLIAGLFLFASLDEISELHENVGQWLFDSQLITGNPKLLREGSPGSPWLRFFVPLIIAAIVGMVAFFFKTLSRKLFLICCGAFLCFGLALGCDYFQGMYDPTRKAIAASLHVDKDWLVYTTVAIEEVVELLGIALLTYAFFKHAEQLSPERAN